MNNPYIGEYYALRSPMLGWMIVRVAQLESDGFTCAIVENLEHQYTNEYTPNRYQSDFIFIRNSFIGSVCFSIGANYNNVSLKMLKLLYE